ncbi:hypothetical protein G9X64_13870 [Rhizobium sophorae]|uniref:Uncharacterized protein n=1 Tax=Rhizobium sophorae TaxID=1535242 RepID=A0A7Y3WEW0_9HYPH|nr:hypothetical protein [Rhizobium sophorae]NNU37558.1 hypothetical protein [Rhizobium sophorae]
MISLGTDGGIDGFDLEAVTEISSWLASVCDASVLVQFFCRVRWSAIPGYCTSSTGILTEMNARNTLLTNSMCRKFCSGTVELYRFSVSCCHGQFMPPDLINQSELR